jgi:hypothetical protein
VTIAPADNRWYAVLDDLDAHIGHQADVLSAGQPELIHAFPLPTGLGPLPPNLQHRLDTLRVRTSELEAEVATRRDQIGRRLAGLPRRRPRASAVASYIDTTA